MFRFHENYFLLFLLLLVTEVLIAIFVHDEFVRPYIGDFLVVILLYCFTKSILQVTVKKAIVMVLVFAYLVEAAQNFAVVNYLGLENNAVAKTVMGTSFDWQDILAYTIGSLFIYLTERIRLGKMFNQQHLEKEN